MTFFHPEAVSADEDAQMTSYMHKYFPGSGGPQEPGERLADLAGVEVADLEDGAAVDAYVAKRFPRGRR